MRKLLFTWPVLNGYIEEWGIFEQDRAGKWQLVRKEHESHDDITRDPLK